MTEIGGLKLASDAAKARRDEAVEKVREALLARAPSWVTWVAYAIAEENATLIVSQRLTRKMKKIVAFERGRAIGVIQRLSFGGYNVRYRKEPITVSNCEYWVNEGTEECIRGLVAEFRRLNLRSPAMLERWGQITQFESADGLSALLEDWATAETAYWEAAKAWVEQADAEERVRASETVAKAWGKETPGITWTPHE